MFLCKGSLVPYMHGQMSLFKYRFSDAIERNLKYDFMKYLFIYFYCTRLSNRVDWILDWILNLQLATLQLNNLLCRIHSLK